MPGGKYRIEINFAGTTRQVVRKPHNFPLVTGCQGNMNRGMRIKTPAPEGYFDDQEYRSWHTPQDLRALAQGIRVSFDSAVHSPEVLRNGYCSGHQDEGERLRSIDPLKFHKLPDRSDTMGFSEYSIERASVQGRNVFYRRFTEEPQERNANTPVNVIDYSVGGSASRLSGISDGSLVGRGGTEEQALYMLMEANMRVQEILDADPLADIEVKVRGESRGGVSASVLYRDMRELYWRDPRIKFTLIQEDPVPGGVMAFSKGFEKHFNPSQGAVHPEIVRDLSVMLGFHGDNSVIDAGLTPYDARAEADVTARSRRPHDRHAVVYSCAPGDGVLLDFFTPQEVIGADVIMLSTDDHELATNRIAVDAQGRKCFQPYTIFSEGGVHTVKQEDVASLPRGIYTMSTRMSFARNSENSYRNFQGTNPADAFLEGMVFVPSETLDYDTALHPRSERKEVLQSVINHVIAPENAVRTHYSPTIGSTSSRFNRSSTPSNRQGLPLLEVDELREAKQRSWVDKIVQRERDEMYNHDREKLSEFEIGFARLRQFMLQPEQYDYVRNLQLEHEKTRQLRLARAIESRRPLVENVLEQAPAVIVDEKKPSLWERFKRFFTSQTVIDITHPPKLEELDKMRYLMQRNDLKVARELFDTSQGSRDEHTRNENMAKSEARIEEAARKGEHAAHTLYEVYGMHDPFAPPLAHDESEGVENEDPSDVPEQVGEQAVDAGFAQHEAHFESYEAEEIDRVRSALPE
jgi:hypothetical protein